MNRLINLLKLLVLLFYKIKKDLKIPKKVEDKKKNSSYPLQLKQKIYYENILSRFDFVPCIVHCGLDNLINGFLAKSITKCLHATDRELVGIIMLIVHQ